MSESLASFFGTRKVTFGFDSTVTNTMHEWATVHAAVKEVREARIVGGMHFALPNSREKLVVEVARIRRRRLDQRR